jgi:hypothetical protein
MRLRKQRKKLNKPRQWDKIPDKRAAYHDVMTRFLGDEAFRRNCLASEGFARQAFLEVGQIDIPADVKIVFLPEGDYAKGAGSSAIIETPPSGTPSDDLEKYYRCTYPVWVQSTSSLNRPKAARKSKTRPKNA